MRTVLAGDLPCHHKTASVDATSARLLCRGGSLLLRRRVVTTARAAGAGRFARQDLALRFARGLLDDPRIGWISITDNPGGGADAAARLAGRAGGRPRARSVVLHLTCKDMNRNGLEAAAWRYASEGFHNILAITGDYPTGGFGGLAEPVFDLDSVGLIALLRSMNDGLEVPGRGGKHRDACPRPTSSSAASSRRSSGTSGS